MLVLGMLFGVLVAGPLVVLGALALANSDRAMAWLGDMRRRWLPASLVTMPDGAQPATDQGGVADAAAPLDGAATG